MIAFLRGTLINILLLFTLSGVLSQTSEETYYQKRLQQVFDIYYESDYHHGILAADEFLKIFPNDAKITFLRGAMKYYLNDFKAAWVDMNRAYELGNEDYPNFMNMIRSKKFFVGMMMELGMYDYEIDSTTLKPVYSLKDTLRGSLRPARTCFDALFYDLTVKIKPRSKSIEGINQIYFEARDSSDQIQLDLFSNLKIDSICNGSEKLSYNRIHDAVFIDFEQPLIPGKTYTIRISYHGKPVEAKNPPWNGGFVWEKKRMKHWVGVACERLGASSWWPMKDHLSDKPDSMRINIQVPEKYEAISNGDLISVKPLKDKYKNFEWFVEYPINSYNVTFYMGKFVNFSDYLITGDDSLRIDYYVLKHNLKKARKYYSNTKVILTSIKELFGDYPFERDGLGFVESPYKGMEHQGAIAIGDDYDTAGYRSMLGPGFPYIVVHELAHEWWGNALAIGDMADAWINEGFATYTEDLLVEKCFGYEKFIEKNAENYFWIFNIWPLVGNRDVNDNTFLTGDIYNKGAAMLNNLRCSMNNDSLFFRMIRDFYQENEFRIVETQDFIDHVHQYAKKDYNSFFNKFLYDDEPPVLEYSFNLHKNKLLFKYRWINVDLGFQMPFSITINDSVNVRLNGKTHYQMFEQENVNSFYLPNARQYDPKLVSPNSFTYYWTRWERR